jgi:hypothetical protein
MSIVLFIIAAILAALVGEEAIGCVTAACRHVLRFRARRLPGGAGERYAEEWQSDLLDRPGGPITKILWTISTVVGARALSAELTADHPTSHPHCIVASPVGIPPEEAFGLPQVETFNMAEAREFLEAGNTRAAVLQAFWAIERKLHLLLVRAGVSVTRLHVGGAQLAMLATDRGLASQSVRHDVEQLALVRNEAAHGVKDVSIDEAAECLVRVDEVLNAIDDGPEAP